jgi:DNA polymerase-3 subunit epsilon
VGPGYDPNGVREWCALLSRIWKRALPAAGEVAEAQPRRPDIVVFDTETTGLAAFDRVVSLGAVRLGPDLVAKEGLHLVFNPGRESHWAAERVHGLSNHYLSFQPYFADHLEEILAFFAGARLVAHNLDFDTRMLNRELAFCGAPLLRDTHGNRCTMNEWRAKSGQGKAGLDVAISHLGLSRQGHIHGALEDAVLAASVLRWLEGVPHDLCSALLPPSNERALPEPISKPHARPRKAAAAAAPTDPANPLSGKRVVLTGDLESLGREEAVAALGRCGAQRQATPNRLTDYVVVGAMPGPVKMRTIRQLQHDGERLRVIGEPEFLRLLRRS